VFTASQSVLVEMGSFKFFLGWPYVFCICVGDSMVTSAIWKNVHEWVFQRASKLHQSEGRKCNLKSLKNSFVLALSTYNSFLASHFFSPFGLCISIKLHTP
jgi:hypothetical protein